MTRMHLCEKVSWEKAAVATLLFLAMAPMPYGYFVFTKIAVCLAAIWEVREATPIVLGKPLPLLWIIIAIVFNPIIPIPLHREWWMIIDGVAGVVFVWASCAQHLSSNKKN